MEKYKMKILFKGKTVLFKRNIEFNIKKQDGREKIKYNNDENRFIISHES